MAITREELRSGEVYITASKDAVTVTAIGDDYLLAKTSAGHEYCYEILYCLETWLLKPKPKKMVELVGFLHEFGMFREVMVRSSEHDLYINSMWKQVSTRTIEVMDE